MIPELGTPSTRRFHIRRLSKVGKISPTATLHSKIRCSHPRSASLNRVAAQYKVINTRTRNDCWPSEKISAYAVATSESSLSKLFVGTKEPEEGRIERRDATHPDATIIAYIGVKDQIGRSFGYLYNLYRPQGRNQNNHNSSNSYSQKAFVQKCRRRKVVGAAVIIVPAPRHAAAIAISLFHYLTRAAFQLFSFSNTDTDTGTDDDVAFNLNIARQAYRNQDATTEAWVACSTYIQCTQSSHSCFFFVSAVFFLFLFRFRRTTFESRRDATFHLLRTWHDDASESSAFLN